jgi:hypothetical protein
MTVKDTGSMNWRFTSTNIELQQTSDRWKSRFFRWCCLTGFSRKLARYALEHNL